MKREGEVIMQSVSRYRHDECTRYVSVFNESLPVGPLQCRGYLKGGGAGCLRYRHHNVCSRVVRHGVIENVFVIIRFEGWEKEDQLKRLEVARIVQ